MKKKMHSIKLIIALALLGYGCASKWEIDNPYKNVDWDNHTQFKANLHTHTTRSDGSHSPQNVVDNYHDLGYKILAITDHNTITYPWESFSHMHPSDQALEKLAKGEIDSSAIQYEDRDAGMLLMEAVKGNEVSSPHHLGSFFNNYEHKLKGEHSTIEDIGKENGLVLLNHPGRYTEEDPEKYNVDWYVDIFNRFDYLTGMEVYNQGDRYPTDRLLWDSVLVRMMPERPIWGYSNDDFHSGIEKLGRNWNIFILPEVSEEWLRQGMLEGRFFYVYAVEGHHGPEIPHIERISVDKKNGSIDLSVHGQDSVQWISGGKVVAQGNSFKISKGQDLKGYVRAMIYGPGSVVGTQPFGIHPVDTRMKTSIL